MKPKVVICGSYHRNPDSLTLLIEELHQTGCQILSPFTHSFTNTTDAFVRSDTDAGFSDYEIERFHLRAIKQSDFVWLYDPDGYIGLSGAFELGFAHSLGKTIFAFEQPSEQYLASITKQVPSVYGAIKQFYDALPAVNRIR